MVVRGVALQADTLRRQIENAVRDSITSGRYPPGSRLVERELCEELGVSRTSLREALRKLEAEKLVEIIPHKGPYVASISVEEASEIYALRVLLEGYAAYEFAKRGTDEALGAFEHEAKVLKAHALAGETAHVLEAKTRLYSLMLGHCGNSLVREMLQSLFSRINLLRATSLMHPDRINQSLAEIESLTLALKKRDSEKAREWASLHVENASRVALKLLRKEQDEGVQKSGSS